MLYGPDNQPISAPSAVQVISETRPPRVKASQRMTWGDVYEAAERSDFRGWFYIPSLSPEDTQTSMTRRAAAERSDWLYKNVGAVTMLIDGLAIEEAGSGLWPKWTSASDDFNRAITDDFHFTNHDPRIFSADGQSDVYSAQFIIRQMIRLYGDCFGQLLRPADGSSQPMMHLIPGYMVDDAVGSTEGSGFRDGVLTNDLRRPIAYRVLIDERKGLYKDVPAADMLHFHDPFLPRQRRGMPALSPVIKRLFRREDIGRALANGTLSREMLGFAITSRQAGSNIGPILPMDGAEAEEITNPDGTKYTVQKIFGDRTDQTEIPELPDGMDIKTVESNRPGTNVREFLDEILTEAAWATKYPPQYIFFLGGMSQGTAARAVLVKARKVANFFRQTQLIPQFCNRWNVFWAWQQIKAGRYASLAIPENWWKHKIIPPPDETVDVGREGRLYDERVSTNRMSIEAYHGMAGEDADDVENENIAAMDRRMKKLAEFNSRHGTSFSYHDMWPRTSQAQPTEAAAQPPPEDS